MNYARMTKKQLIAEIEKKDKRVIFLEKIIEFLIHDLKRFILSIIGHSKKLHRMYENPEGPKASMASKIIEIARYADRLIEDSIALMESGRNELIVEDFTLSEIITTLRTLFSAKMKSRDVELLVPNYEIKLQGSKSEILLIFLNIIENNLKYGGKNLNVIRIGYKETPKFHILTISNDGAGIKEEYREKIFELRERDKNTSDSIPGSGFGLAIVREFAERHGGTAIAKSDGIRGVKFVITISKNL